MKYKANKLSQGHYIYRGFEVECMSAGQWNFKPVDTDTWTDAANSLTDAKSMIDNYGE